MKRKDNNEFDLTEAEVEVLGRNSTPPMIRTFISRQQESIGTRTSAYRKIAAAARAEREAMQEIIMVEVARDRLENPDDWRKQIKKLDDDKRALEVENERLRQDRQREIAAPAMVSYGD